MSSDERKRTVAMRSLYEYRAYRIASDGAIHGIEEEISAINLASANRMAWGRAVKYLEPQSDDSIRVEYVRPVKS